MKKERLVDHAGRLHDRRVQVTDVDAIIIEEVLYKCHVSEKDVFV